MTATAASFQVYSAVAYFKKKIIYLFERERAQWEEGQREREQGA